MPSGAARGSNRLGPAEKDPKDIDAKLAAESRRLLREMNELTERARRLLGARKKTPDAGAPAPRATPGTLGAVLYSRPSHMLVAEADWVSLLRSIAAGDRLALQALCGRTHRLIFALIERITGDPAMAEALTLDVLYGIWRRAALYDVADGTVLGWIMNQARQKAIDARRDAKPAPRPAAGVSAVPLEARLAWRIAAEDGGQPVPPPESPWLEPSWQEVAPGISVKLLATDTERHMISMLVRLAPGTSYPAHTHAGLEELHLLEGELWIDERKLYPGDYNRAEPGTGDDRVWSETGCMCFLVTSVQDQLR